MAKPIPLTQLIGPSGPPPIPNKTSPSVICPSSNPQPNTNPIPLSSLPPNGIKGPPGIVSKGIPTPKSQKVPRIHPQVMQQIIQQHIRRNHPHIWASSNNSTYNIHNASPIVSSVTHNGTVYTNSAITSSNMMAVNTYFDDDYDDYDNPGHTLKELYDLILSTLYSTQHLPIDSPDLISSIEIVRLLAGNLKIQDGNECKLHLPDGSVLEVDKNGSYKIEDKDAKVIYRANRVRDFNTYINASDKLEEFIRYCGTQGVTQSEMLDLPINLFIAWLVIEAARQDQIYEPTAPLISGIKKITKSRCDQCGRFMKKSMRLKGINYCRSECYTLACSQC